MLLARQGEEAIKENSRLRQISPGKKRVIRRWRVAEVTRTKTQKIRSLVYPLLFACVGLGAQGCLHQGQERQTRTFYLYSCFKLPNRIPEMYWDKTFAIYPSTQVVVTKGAARLQNCAIYDADNWSCQHTSGAVTLVLGGELVHDHIEEYKISGSVTISVRRYEYWVKGFFEESHRRQCRTILASEIKRAKKAPAKLIPLP
jgi:hypothetical protein